MFKFGGVLQDRGRGLRQSAADLGAMILEMEREEEFHGVHTKRMAELMRVRALQEKVVLRMLDSCIEGDARPKGRHLTVVK